MLEAYLDAFPEVHPDAYVHSTAVLIGNVIIGAESTVWPNTTLRGDDARIVVGARTSIQDGTVVHVTEDLSETHIGDQVTVGHRCVIHGARIADNCIIGMGSVLLDNAQIGSRCLIGAGSLITQGVVIPPQSLVLGSPGKVVRQLTEKELEWIEYSWKRYVEQCHIYKARDSGG